MHSFSQRSQDRLAGVDPRLKTLLNAALSKSVVDFGIPKDGGKRTAERQNEIYCTGASKCDGYEKTSKHQTGSAVDVIAYVNGRYTFEPKYYYMIAAVILSEAKRLGLGIRWGGDWDRDLDFQDQTFNDLMHFELV